MPHVYIPNFGKISVKPLQRWGLKWALVNSSMTNLTRIGAMCRPSEKPKNCLLSKFYTRIPALCAARNAAGNKYTNRYIE